jgi:hypothetical protein
MVLNVKISEEMHDSSFHIFSFISHTFCVSILRRKCKVHVYVVLLTITVNVFLKVKLSLALIEASQHEDIYYKQC